MGVALGFEHLGYLQTNVEQFLQDWTEAANP
jgi:hypothetical protein